MLPIWSKFASPCRRAARWPQARRRPSALRPTLELLDRRDLPAVQLSYVGPGTPLFLEDLSAAVDNVTISEPSPNVLRIDLNGATFDTTSAAAATGLAYQNAGSPTTSTFATVDISTTNAVSTLVVAFTGSSQSVTLGMTNAVGGVGALNLEAGAVTLNAVTMGADGTRGSVLTDATTLAVAGAINVPALGTNGIVSLGTDDINILPTGTINTGFNPVTIGSISAARAVDLGTDTPGTLGLAADELQRVKAGQITIFTTGDITVSQPVVVTGAPVLVLRANGEIINGATADQPALTVGTLSLNAGTGIGGPGGLETAVTNLSFQNSAGAVQVTNAGPLTLAASQNGGTTTLAAHGALTFQGSVSSTGSLTATAIDSPAAGDDLTIASNVAITSNGDLALRAGDNLNIGGSSQVRAGGTMTLAVDFGDADPGIGGVAAPFGWTNSPGFSLVDATLAAPGGINVVGGPDNDTFDLDAFASTPISVDGDAGNDALVLNTLNSAVVVTKTGVAVGNGSTVTYSNIGGLQLLNSKSTVVNGTASDETFVLATSVRGAAGTPQGMPLLAPDFSHPVTVNGQSGNDAVVIDDDVALDIIGGLSFVGISAYTLSSTDADL